MVNAPGETPRSAASNGANRCESGRADCPSERVVNRVKSHTIWRKIGHLAQISCRVSRVGSKYWARLASDRRSFRHRLHSVFGLGLLGREPRLQASILGDMNWERGAKKITSSGEPSDSKHLCRG